MIRRSARNGRGGALLELAIAVPIIIALMALIVDTGLGFSAAQDSSSAARSAARVAAQAGESRLADFRAIDAVRAQFSDSDDELVWVTVYRSVAGSEGLPPADCLPGTTGSPGWCNVYSGTQIEAAVSTDFDDPDCTNDLDVQWCPTTRADDADDYLGVAVWTSHEPTVGLIVPDGGAYELQDRAVFALYFNDDA